MFSPTQVSVRELDWQAMADDGLAWLPKPADQPCRCAAPVQKRERLHVLVSTGCTEVLERLTVGLIHAGHEVGTARDGHHALERWRLEQPDLVVLDSALPELDGLEVCRRIRERSHTPIVLLVDTADAEEQIVRGLELGADEVLLSTNSSRLLVAQVQAVARRALRQPARTDAMRLHVGDLIVDLQMHQVFRGSELIRLTRLEFRLLCLLMATAGQVVPYKRLVRDAWGYTDEPTPHLLRAPMSRLRRKLALERAGSVSIEAILGTGYRLSFNPGSPIGTNSPDAGRSVPGHPTVGGAEFHAASPSTYSLPGPRREPVRCAIPRRFGPNRWAFGDDRLGA
jgi:two-component system, OmpR family, response regulator MtrA